MLPSQPWWAELGTAAGWWKAQCVCQICRSLANSGRDSVSQERYVPQEELLALLGLWKVLLGMGLGCCWCVRTHFIKLKPAWGRALWHAYACAGICRAAPSDSFFAISGLCKVHLSNLLSQGSNTQCAGSAFLGSNQKNFCAVFSIQSVMALAEDLTIAKKRFFLSAFSGMKYTVSIHVKHKSLIIFSKFWRCFLLPAINCRCEHNSKIKSRMQAY